MPARRSTVTELREAIAAIPDPEVPVVTIEDLGILRDVAADEDTGHVVVTITPTYSGCPAMAAISDYVAYIAARHGWQARIDTVLEPAWTTDWLSEKGREALRRFGIAPPRRREGGVAVPLGRHTVACPHCGSTDTEELAHFGSTACKAMRRCRVCREPFDEFKEL